MAAVAPVAPLGGQHPAMPLPQPQYTVANAIYDCGVTDGALFMMFTKAERIATELFDDDFASCLDKTPNDPDDDLKSYSSLTAANDQLRLAPGPKRNIKSFIQWARDQYCLGNDPTLVRFPVAKRI
jgi:hypothetical protein